MTCDEFLYGKRHAPPVLKKLDDIANEVNTKLNSQAGRMKHYASFNLLLDYMDALPDELSSIVYYDLDKQKFGFQEGGKELCMMKEKEHS